MPDARSARAPGGAAPTAAATGEVERPREGLLRREHAILAALLVVALGLRLFGLGAQSVWIDEAQSLSWSRLAVGSIVHEGAHYNQAPFYFILLRGWMALGPETEVWARLLSALLGTAFVAVFYGLVREIARPPVPLVAAGLMALSPFAVWHAQDARMYALMLFGSGLGLLLLLRYLRLGGGGRLAGSCVALTCSLYTHLYMVFLLPVLIIFLWTARRDTPAPRLRRGAIAVALVGVAYLPWIATVVTSSRLEAGFYRPIGALSLPYALYAFSVGYSLGPSVAELHHQDQLRSTLLAHGPVIALAGAAFGLVFLRGLAGVRRWCGARAPLVAALLVLPLLFPVLVTLLSRVTFNARYAIAAFPAYVLILGIGLASLRSRALAMILGAALAGLMAASLAGHYFDPAYAKDDTRAAYEHIRARREAGDCSLVIGVTEAFRHYEGRAAASRWLDLRAADRIPAAEETLRAWSRECAGLWVVAGRTWEEDPLGVVDRLVRRHFVPVEEARLAGLRIARYRAAAGGGPASAAGKP